MNTIQISILTFSFSFVNPQATVAAPSPKKGKKAPVVQPEESSSEEDSSEEEVSVRLLTQCH